MTWAVRRILGRNQLTVVQTNAIPWWRHQMEKFSALRSPVNSPHKGQWRGALMISLICAWINGWVNKREAGNLRRYLAHHDVTVMQCCFASWHLHGAWNRNALRINGPLWGNPPVTDGLPPKLSVVRIFGIVSDVSLNKLLNLRP